MTTALVYCYPNIGNRHYDECAKRFASHYAKNPPGLTEHELFVVVNGGGEITKRQESLFEPLAPKFIYHDNSGKDVGAHRMAARVIPCDLVIFLGAPCWPGKPMWLDRIVQVYEELGPALYGNFCFHAPAPHVRTTFYWGPPHIFNSHTLPIRNDLRYDWEHGSNSITRHAMKLGFNVIQVTWSWALDIGNWTHVPEEECLMYEQHTERIHYGFGR